MFLDCQFWTPWTIAIYTWFERISMMVILINCITLGMYRPCQDDFCDSQRCKILQVSSAPFTYEQTWGYKLKICERMEKLGGENCRTDAIKIMYTYAKKGSWGRYSGNDVTPVVWFIEHLRILSQVVDDVIFGFFAVEMVIKILAMGLHGKGTYLEDSWNRLDCFIVVAGLVRQTVPIQGRHPLIVMM